MPLNTVFSAQKKQLVFLVAGLLTIAAAFALDNTVDGCFFLSEHGSAWKVALALSKYGDWVPVLLGGLALVAGLAIARKFTAGRLLLLILVAGLLTGLASTLIRSTTGRTRPLAKAPQGFYGLRYHSHWIAGKYEFSSFPSGHTAVWAGLAGAAWFRQRRLAIVFLAVGAAVAWSRMALGCHHFSDVTASMVWGLAVGPWLCDRLEQIIYGMWGRAGLPG